MEAKFNIDDTLYAYRLEQDYGYEFYKGTVIGVEGNSYQVDIAPRGQEPNMHSFNIEGDIFFTVEAMKEALTQDLEEQKAKLFQEIDEEHNRWY